MNHLLPLLTNALFVVAAVFIHYEVLNRLSRTMPALPLKPRARITVGVLGVLLAHSVEVALFALGYWVGGRFGHGELAGDFSGSAADYIYFSYATFTTVGFGDIVPLGHFRWLAGLESLTGFVLITWTASFLYLEMSQNWRRN